MLVNTKVRNYLRVRRYAQVAELAQWCVLRNEKTREVVAHSRQGLTLGLTFSKMKPRQNEGGVIHRVVTDEYNLELDDHDVIKAVQEALISNGSFPLVGLLEALGIADRMLHSEALSDGVVRYEASLRDEWLPGFVSARLEYGVFVPVELEPFVTKAR